MEVLIAMGIFLIGVISVAALFPTALVVQRDTIESLMGQQISRQARDQLQAIAASGAVNPNPQRDALTYHHDLAEASRRGTLREYTTHNDNDISLNPGRNLRVMPLIQYVGPDGMDIAALAEDTSGNSANVGGVPVAPITGFTPPPPYPANSNARGFGTILSRGMRSYPSTGEIDTRDYYWLPFIQAGGDPSDPTTTELTWSAFVIVMHRQTNMQVPQVRWADAVEGSALGRIDWSSSNPPLDNDEDDDGTPDIIKPGDFILADNGLVHRVVLADKDGCTVGSQVLQNAGLTLQRIYFVVDVDDFGRVKRQGPSPVAWIDGPFPLPVQDPGP